MAGSRARAQQTSRPSSLLLHAACEFSDQQFWPQRLRDKSGFAEYGRQIIPQITGKRHEGHALPAELMRDVLGGRIAEPHVEHRRVAAGTGGQIEGLRDSPGGADDYKAGFRENVRNFQRRQRPVFNDQHPQPCSCRCDGSISVKRCRKRGHANTENFSAVMPRVQIVVYRKHSPLDCVPFLYKLLFYGNGEVNP